MSSLVGPDLPNRRLVGLVTQIVARSASEISRLRSAVAERRQLDVPEALEDRVPEQIVARPVRIVDFRGEHWPDPDDVFRRAVERGSACPQRHEPLEQRVQSGAVEAGADLAAIVQLPVVPLAKRQRRKPLSRLRCRVAGDDEIADGQRLGLGPCLRAAALIGRGCTLGDDAFEAEFGCPFVECVAIAFDMVAELDRRTAGRVAGQQLREQRLASDERRLPEIPAVEEEQGRRHRRRACCRRLPTARPAAGREAADALVVEHDDLSVDDRTRGRAACGTLREGRRSALSSRVRRE